MKSSQKGFIIPLLLTLIALILVGGGAYVYLHQTHSDESASQENEATSSVATTSPLSCGAINALLTYVMQTIEKPDSQGDVLKDAYDSGGFEWKRSPSEPFIAYPIAHGVIANYSDDNTTKRTDSNVAAIANDFNLIDQSIATETVSLGLTPNQLNTSPLQYFPIGTYANGIDVATFAFTQNDGSIYSVVLHGEVGIGAPGYGSVMVTCGGAIPIYDKVYDLLNLKANTSAQDPYDNDHLEIGAVSPDNTVFALVTLGAESNPIYKGTVANYYYFDGTSLKLVSTGSYPADCSTLQSQKVGLGMSCYNSNNTSGTVSYSSATTSDSNSSFISTLYSGQDLVSSSSPTVGSSPNNSLTLEYSNDAASYYNLTFNCDAGISVNTNRISGNLCGTVQKILSPSNSIPLQFVSNQQGKVSVSLDSYLNDNSKIDTKSITVNVVPINVTPSSTSATPASPKLMIVYPDTQDNIDDFQRGNNINIQWSTSGTAVFPVDIDLLNEAGISVQKIASDVTNTGNYSWSISTTLSAGNYKIEIDSSAVKQGPAIYTQSGYFTLK